MFADKVLNPRGVIVEAFNDAAFRSGWADLESPWFPVVKDKDKDRGSRSELFIAAEVMITPGP